jgi:hypothetical protein
MFKIKHRAAAIVMVSIGLMTLVSVPVMAEISRLTAIPLGKGSATISWTGKSGIAPTIRSIHGSARGLAIDGSGTVPQPPKLHTGSSVSLPPNLPLSDINGTISGTRFSLDITLNVAGLNLSSDQPLTLGMVTGSFRGQPINAVLTGRRTSTTISFSGTIGNDHVTGVIARLVRQGNKSTAYATFDVTR